MNYGTYDSILLKPHLEVKHFLNTSQLNTVNSTPTNLQPKRQRYTPNQLNSFFSPSWSGTTPNLKINFTKIRRASQALLKIILLRTNNVSLFNFIHSSFI
jgi:hypothetical protein